MKVRFLVIGKTTDKYLLPGIEDYNKRLNRYCNYEYLELTGVRLGKSATADETKRKEEEIILSKLEKSDFLVLMDEKGREFTSKGFGEFLKNHQMLSIVATKYFRNSKLYLLCHFFIELKLKHSTSTPFG